MAGVHLGRSQSVHTPASLAGRHQSNLPHTQSHAQVAKFLTESGTKLNPLDPNSSRPHFVAAQTAPAQATALLTSNHPIGVGSGSRVAAMQPTGRFPSGKTPSLKAPAVDSRKRPLGVISAPNHGTGGKLPLSALSSARPGSGGLQAGQPSHSQKNAFASAFGTVDSDSEAGERVLAARPHGEVTAREEEEDRLSKKLKVLAKKEELLEKVWLALS